MLLYIMSLAVPSLNVHLWKTHPRVLWRHQHKETHSRAARGFKKVILWPYPIFSFQLLQIGREASIELGRKKHKLDMVLIPPQTEQRSLHVSWLSFLADDWKIILAICSSKLANLILLISKVLCVYWVEWVYSEMHCLSHCRLFKLLNHYLATFLLGLLFQCFLFPGSLNWGVTSKDWPAFLRSWKNLLPIEVLFYFSFLSCPQRACHRCNKAYKITLNFKHCLFIFGFILYHRLNIFCCN